MEEPCWHEIMILYTSSARTHHRRDLTALVRSHIGGMGEDRGSAGEAGVNLIWRKQPRAFALPLPALRGALPKHYLVV